jgi:hypothetical protein
MKNFKKSIYSKFLFVFLWVFLVWIFSFYSFTSNVSAEAIPLCQGESFPMMCDQLSLATPKSECKNYYNMMGNQCYYDNDKWICTNWIWCVEEQICWNNLSKKIILSKKNI